MLVFFWLRHRDEEAKIEPDRTPPVPSIPQLTPVPAPEERAAELRRNALHECDLGNLGDCLKGLDEAKELDPAGDTAPAIQNVRNQIRFIQRASDSKIPNGDKK